MTDYSNWKLLKSELDEKQEEYTTIAIWCNKSNQYHIEDIGDYYKVVENAKPTIEELQEQVKYMCSYYINEICWRVERYNTQKELGVETTDNTEMYFYILEYMQYLRKYDDQSGEWWLSYPKTFEEWLNLNENNNDN